MKTRLTSFMFFFLAPLALAQSGLPQLGRDPVEKVVAAMTLQEKAGLLVGDHEFAKYTDGTVKDAIPGIAGTTLSIPRLGIPVTYETDGPAGVNIDATRPGESRTYFCTAFPIGSLLASTWDVDVVREVGECIGNEALEYGCDIVLAPAINLHRNPLCGRNFEYYSEDPLVSGKIASAFINGVQSQGVGTSLKHFAANNQETFRRENDARISQRALRELYLKSFEIAVKESRPWTVMSSYNLINGKWVNHSYPLMTTVLRDEWGFDGYVMTDWIRDMRNTAEEIHAGTELLQPGFPAQVDDIIECVKNGRLTEADIDLAVTRILKVTMKTPSFRKYPHSDNPDLAAHAEVTRRSAAEGMVLLKNDSSTLPMAGSKVALFGLGSYDLLAIGIGSGEVHNAYTVNMQAGLENAGYSVQPDLASMYEGASEEVRISKKFAELRAQDSDVAIVTLRRNAGEYNDRHCVEGDFLLTALEREMLENVSEAFHKAGKKMVVILNSGGVIETSSWKGLADAILLAWQPGVEGGNSIIDILTGKINPSGKLTMTWPVDYMDIPSSKNFPYDFFGESWRKDRRLIYPYDKNTGYTNYDEGIWVGYRYFSTDNVPVSFPFGFGLSYTTFEYGKAAVKRVGNEYQVSVNVTNTGKAAGKEVAELYLAAPGNDMAKPARELKAFAKTRLLQPGESQTLTLKFAVRDMASFDEALNCWVAETGEYTVLLGSSVEDIRTTATLSLTKKYTEKVLTRI